MRLDVNRLHRLRRIARDRKALWRAASDDRFEQRERLQDLQRSRQRIEQNTGPTREPEALADLDNRIKAARAELAAMQDREAELATASNSAGRTFQRAVDFTQEAGLDLPDDMKPRNFGAPAAPAAPAAQGDA